jgi:hypothetical protein
VILLILRLDNCSRLCAHSTPSSPVEMSRPMPLTDRETQECSNPSGQSRECKKTSRPSANNHHRWTKTKTLSSWQSSACRLEPSISMSQHRKTTVRRNHCHLTEDAGPRFQPHVAAWRDPLTTCTRGSPDQARWSIHRRVYPAAYFTVAVWKDGMTLLPNALGYL